MTRKHTKKFQSAPIAIIGMACLFPKSSGLKKYWRLIARGEDGITNIPESHWSAEDYFDPDPNKPDHVYCKRGGFLSPIPFDPIEFGIPPNTLKSTDTSQILSLVSAKKALEDAGYGNGRPFDRDRTSVILGATGTQELAIALGSRLGHPNWRKALTDAGISYTKTEDVIKRISDSYVPWQENSFPGLLGNVIAGRICNRLDLGGTNCVVDAACASSLSALHLAVLELVSGRSDMVVTGGVDTLNDIFMHMCFSKTFVLSPTGDARPFSKDADGTVLGEGIGMLVLKRLEDAENTGDRIYAKINAIGTSSDGRSQSIYAPRPEGQAKALRMAYAEAAADPSTIELIEAHGTGTRVGDKVELQALTQVFTESFHGAIRPKKSDQTNRWCAIGSVKSMIGHTKAAAGAAGIIKSALSLYHKVLPPTLKADIPDPELKITETPFYLNTTLRPWFSKKEHPRRSGVSAFGFGGSNFHVILEEYRPHKQKVSWDGSVEIVALSASTKENLLKSIRNISNIFGTGLPEHDISMHAAESRCAFSSKDPYRMLFVIEYPFTPQKLSRLFTCAVDALETEDKTNSLDLKNIFYGGPEYMDQKGPCKTAFLFPGQGSQYLNMGRDLVCLFPEAINVINRANDHTDRFLLSDYIYPIPAAAQTQKEENRLRNTEIAQPAIGAVSLAMLRVLERFGVKPDATCGHSFGELTALCAAGRIDDETFLNLSFARGRIMAEAGNNNAAGSGCMLAVCAPLDRIDAMLADQKIDAVLANRNSPNQGVLSGSKEAIEQADAECRRLGFKTTLLPVSAAFHSKLVRNAQKPFMEILNQVKLEPPAASVFSNTTGEEYPANPDKCKNLLIEQLIHPVDFVKNIENLFQTGIRIFLEVGPKPVLTGLVKSILNGHPIQVLAMDRSSGKQSGVLDLARTLCHLAAIGKPVDFSLWEEPANTKKSPQMCVAVAGANFKPEKNKTTMNQTHQKQSDFITNALHMTQQTLKSMQELQKQTAEAHQKFLETQTEAGRMLREMIKNTQRLVEASIGIGERRPENSVKNTSGQASMPQFSLISEQASDSIPDLKSDPIPNEAPFQPVEQPYAEDQSEKPPRTQPANDKIETRILAIVSELTGYPEEMIGLDMDIEADLGIDSIKRVEILSAMEEAMPDLPGISPDVLGTLKTLGQVVEYLVNPANPVEPELRSETDRPSMRRAESSGSSLDQTEIQQALLKVVGDLTGYPEEMIGLDMDIEADLGIDSIKRVEILSAMEETMPELPPISPDVLGTLKTLGQVVEHLTSVGSFDAYPHSILEDQSVTASNSETPSQLDFHSNDDTHIEIGNGVQQSNPVERRIVSVVEDPPRQGITMSIPNGQPVLVTDDKNGLSKAIVDEFALQGVDAILIDVDTPRNRLDEDINLRSAAGLVIVSGLELSRETDETRSGDRFLKQAFRLARLIASKLIAATAKGDALFATVTRLDGGFGFRGKAFNDPVQGGLSALSKTAAKEWAGVCCRAIDVASDWEDHQAIARAVVSELLVKDPAGPNEIGFDSKSRFMLLLQPAPYSLNRRIDINMDPQDVVVITGGARGITALAAYALARHAQPTLVLLGRSPLPPPPPEWLADIKGEASVKKAILDNEFAGAKATPAKIEKSFQRHMADREITQNLEKLRQAGVNVIYRSVDVRNAVDVQTVIDSIRSDYGPIKAVIHGAGVLEDRLIVDKTAEQFNRVFDTKVEGLRSLLRATRSDSLRYLVLFSSVSARMGNRGQSDYAIANEVLNKMAWKEAHKRPHCKVISINWGPWDGGMVSSSLKKAFQQKHINLIEPDAGAMCMLYEMSEDKNGPKEVVVGAEMPSENLSAALPDIFSKKPRPHVSEASSRLSLTVQREIDVDRYPILKSHVLNGQPVVPLALMTEWLGHCALHENPGLFLHGLDDIRVLKGIVLTNGKKTIRLLAGKARKKESVFEVDVEIRDGVKDNKEIIHSRAKAILTDSPDAPPIVNRPMHSEALTAKTYFRSIDDVYEKILFHGSQLRGIRDIINCSATGMIARISSAPSPSEWMSDPLRSSWLGDPLALDAAFQMATVWCFEYTGKVSLPSYSASYRQYCKKFPSQDLVAVLEVKNTTEHKMLGDFTFLDANHNVAARLIGCETIMDESLFKAFKP